MRNPITRERHYRHTWRPGLRLLLAFIAVILAGALLLLLPAARALPGRADPLTALFTATSATCVTGLSIVDVGSYYSRFGQFIIMLLMQVGGIGIMTVASFTFVVLGHRLSVNDESLLATDISEVRSSGILPLLRSTILFALLFEAIGTLLLAWRYHLTGCSLLEALHQGFFHAVSAFCNCGFSLMPKSLQTFQSDTIYCATISLLILLGGIGFPVLYNLGSFRFWQRDRHTRGRITAHSRMALQMTCLLVILGSVLYLLLERHHALADRSISDKISNALTQVICMRTAGFNVVDPVAQTEVSRHLFMTIMFVGGSPGSTAGGIKTTTLMVLILTVISMVRDRASVRYGARSIPETVVRQAIAIFFLGLACIGIVFSLLLITEAPAPGSAVSMPLLFETVSALSTTGMSLNMTPNISFAGRCLLVCAMFIGRIGPLTIVVAVSRKRPTETLHYPAEEVIVG